MKFQDRIYWSGLASAQSIKLPLKNTFKLTSSPIFTVQDPKWIPEVSFWTFYNQFLTTHLQYLLHRLPMLTYWHLFTWGRRELAGCVPYLKGDIFKCSIIWSNLKYKRKIIHLEIELFLPCEKALYMTFICLHLVRNFAFTMAGNRQEFQIQ